MQLLEYVVYSSTNFDLFSHMLDVIDVIYQPLDSLEKTALLSLDGCDGKDRPVSLYIF